MEVIIKPTEACNGTCVYCSADGTLEKRDRIRPEQLGEIFERFKRWLTADDRRNLRFVWHGGEPMLCGPAYFDTVVHEQQRVFGDDLWRVKNTMQSNLSLVDERWVPTLKALLRDGAVGSSFDIVPDVRGLAGDRDLSDVWVRAVRMLRSHGIDVGVVYVAHRQSLGRARDLYYFFRNLDPKLNVRYNALYKEGRGAADDTQALWITAEEYGQFLVDLCEVWLADNRRTSSMPLGEWYRAWQGEYRLCCDSRGDCHNTHMGISPNGDVYGCGRASDNAAHKLGNIYAAELEDILSAPPRGAMHVRAMKLQGGHCQDCRWWRICHGGCPTIAWLYYGDLHRETYFCAARKRIFEHFERLFGPPAHLQQPARARPAGRAS